MLPGNPYRRGRAVKEIECNGANDAGHGGRDGCCPEEHHYVIRFGQGETGTMVAVNQPGCERGLESIETAEDKSTPDISIAKHVRQNGSGHCAEDDWPSRARAQDDQSGCRHACRRPEDSAAFEAWRQFWA